MKRLISLFIAILSIFAINTNLLYAQPQPSPGSPYFTPQGSGAYKRLIPDKLLDYTVSIQDYSTNGLSVGNTTAINGTCSITGGSPSLHCFSQSFVAADVGKYVVIHGANTNVTALQSKINAVTDSHTVTLADNAVLTTPANQLSSVTVGTSQSGSGSYAPSDTITLAGGTQVTPPILQVNTTTVVSVAASAAGTGCTNGTYAATGTTGQGTLFHVNLTITTNVITSVGSITVAGVYGRNPANIASEPVAGITGCVSANAPTVALKMGVLSVFVRDAGLISNAPPTSFTQASTSGAGTGATFISPTWSLTGGGVYGNDDTGAFTAALAQATARHGCVYFPATSKGVYWLATATASYDLQHICLKGDGAQAANEQFTDAGSMVFISNLTTASFIIHEGVNIDDVGFAYPAQDGYSINPIVYPALFEAGPSAGSRMTNANFNNVYVANAYSLLYSSPSDSLGRVQFNNVHAYCIQYCFDLLNGFADILSINSGSSFSAGFGGTRPVFGPGKYLETYTVQNGEFIHLDASSGNYNNFDGLKINGAFVYGMRYGVRVKGTNTVLDVSELDDILWDGVPTVLSVEDSACVASTYINGGHDYSTQSSFLPATGVQNVFDFIATGCPTPTEVSITGFGISYAQGHGVNLSSSSQVKVNWAGGSIDNWGQSTTAGNYAGFNLFSLTNAVSINGVLFRGNQLGGHGNYGIQGTIAFANIVGNYFFNTYAPISVSSNTVGTWNISSNISQNSTIQGGVQNAILTGGLVYSRVDNSWDRPNIPVLTSGFGTGAAHASWDTNWRGNITIGTGPSGSFTLTFGTGVPSGVQPHPPVCNGVNITTGVVIPVTNVTNTLVTFTGAVVSGDVFQYGCDL